jgi:hypothetical protein
MKIGKRLRLDIDEDVNPDVVGTLDRSEYGRCWEF